LALRGKYREGIVRSRPRRVSCRCFRILLCRSIRHTPRLGPLLLPLVPPPMHPIPLGGKGSDTARRPTPSPYPRRVGDQARAQRYSAVPNDVLALSRLCSWSCVSGSAWRGRSGPPTIVMIQPCGHPVASRVRPVATGTAHMLY